MKFWLVLTFCFSLFSIYGQNPHDTPTSAFPLTITPTDTLNYITKDNINAQIEADGTPQACGSSLEYDVFGKIQTDANTTDFTIHFQNIDPNIFLTVQLLDENGNQISCTFYVGSGIAPYTNGQISPNSTYYIKLLDATYDGLHEGNFDIAVTSNTVLPVEYTYIRGQSHDNTAHIHWETAQEVNSSHFIVREHLPSGKIIELDKLTAAGNTSETQQYHTTINYEHEQLSPTKYYSLTQYDFDGQFEISDVFSINFHIKDLIIEIPTLVHQAQIIAHVIPRNKKITASITNMNGQQLATQTLHVGTNYFPQLPPGQYAVSFYDSYQGLLRTQLIVIY